MPENRSISELLAPVVLDRRAPLGLKALIGEIITLDSRLLGYDSPVRRRGHEGLGEFLEAYDRLVHLLTINIPSEQGDWEGFSQSLKEVKDKLTTWL